MSPILLITSAVIILAAILFAYLEYRIPYTKGKKLFREGFWLDFVWYTLIQSYFLGILIFSYIIAPIETSLGINQQGLISHWPMWLLILFFTVTHDFYIYWFHRAQHNSKLLWRLHEAHHSVRTCDWLAGSRSHALEIIINQTIEFAPIILLLDTQTAAILIPVKGMIDAIWGMFIHSNIHLPLGKSGYFINGPGLHQWHHAEHKEVYFANYATKLAIWDYLFGTLYNPDHKPVKYGLPYSFPKDYFVQHVFSIFRFDVKKLESNKYFNFYNNLRIKTLNTILSLWGIRKTEHYSLILPDQKPADT